MVESLLLREAGAGAKVWDGAGEKKSGAGQKRTATLSTTLTLTGTGIYLNSWAGPQLRGQGTRSWCPSARQCGPAAPAHCGIHPGTGSGTASCWGGGEREPGDHSLQGSVLRVCVHMFAEEVKEKDDWSFSDCGFRSGGIRLLLIEWIKYFFFSRLY